MTGTLDDYVGDEVMAVFGTPEPAKDDAARAIKCAHAMRRIIDDRSAERAGAGQTPVRIGIGVHFGPVVVGSTGSEARLKFAVIGDTVNVASRLQSSTRDLRCELVVSKAALLAAGEEVIQFRQSGGVELARSFGLDRRHALWKHRNRPEGLKRPSRGGDSARRISCS